jgi:hypothetical protein
MKWAGQLLVIALISGLVGIAAAQDVVHMVSGVVTKVDKDAKTIGVRTADGTEHVFKYSDKTLVRGYHESSSAAKAGVMDTYFKGKEGSEVVVGYSKKGGDDVAAKVEDFGKDSQQVAKGVVTKVDKTGHRLTVKTEDGSEKTFDFGKDAAGDSEHGAVRGWDYTATKAKEGDKVVLHYTESSGKKIVHFFEE